MPELEIIDKVDVPEGYSKWHFMIDRLDYGKAIRLVYPDKGTAIKQRDSVLGTFRGSRLSKYDYSLCTRLYPFNKDQWALFIWKEIKGG